MNRKCLIYLSLLVSACGAVVTEPMPDIPETVEYETVRIEYGDDDLVDAPSDARPQALVGDLALLADSSQRLVRGTNSIIALHMAIVAAVTRQTPTAYSDGTWTWDNAEFKAADERFSTFAIRQTGPGAYAYIWRVGNSAEELLEIFSGEFRPDPREDGRQRGSGILRFDFSNMHAIDPESTPEQGRAVVAFRAAGGVRQVHVATFDLLEAGETTPRSGQYRYVQFRDRAGRLQFVAQTDFLKDGAPHEEVAIDAVWERSQAGRALASLTGGSLLVNEVLLHECWDEASRTVFADATPDLPGVPYEDGAQTACSARLLEFELDPPALAAPGDDPAIPSPHPDET